MMFRLAAALFRPLRAAPLALAVLGAGALAQPTQPLNLALASPPRSEASATAATPVVDDAERALLLAFGNRAGLARLSDHFVDRLVADPRIGHFFKEVKPAHLKQQLADQFCQVLSGPCAYDGETMKNSHAELGIRRADFLILVELLQDSMDAQAVPFAAQNALLARLAPMHRDIVTR